MLKFYGIFLVLLSTRIALAQQIVYDNYVYRPEIKSVQFFNTAKEASFPVINLRSNEQVLLAFDDLHAQSRYLSYTIEHCDAQWQSSHLSPAEYLQSFTDDRLMDYRYSSNTLQKYIHYELRLPNQNIIPKIPGNYLLKVFEDGDQNKLVITRRLYVLNARAGIGAEVAPSANTALRQSNQKINFQVDYAGLTVQNPYNDIKVLVMQNAVTQTAVLNSRPTYIRGTQLIYNDFNANDFSGGNEYRHVDTRTLKLNSDRTGRIYRDTANTVMLLADRGHDEPNYTFQYDNNGSFFILNQDGRDPRTDADYAHVVFSLLTNKKANEGTPYIVGQFNDYRLNAQSRLTYDANQDRFFAGVLLKQGVYDYRYVWLDKITGKADDIAFEGTHFETENEYQLLVYYRAPGARWDELIGYRVLSQGKR